MKRLLLFTALFLQTCDVVFAQAVPSGYTPNYRLRRWASGANPSADSLNANWNNIDSILKYMGSSPPSSADYFSSVIPTLNIGGSEGISLSNLTASGTKTSLRHYQNADTLAITRIKLGGTTNSQPRLINMVVGDQTKSDPATVRMSAFPTQAVGNYEGANWEVSVGAGGRLLGALGHQQTKGSGGGSIAYFADSVQQKWGLTYPNGTVAYNYVMDLNNGRPRYTFGAVGGTGVTGKAYLPDSLYSLTTLIMDASRNLVNINNATIGGTLGVTGATTLTKVSATDSSGTIGWGTYTPTLFNVTNVAASTAYVCQYTRVGKVVTVSGRVDIDPTATGASELGMSLPIASALVAANQMGGTGVQVAIADNPVGILADATNDRASFQWVAIDIANHGVFFSFTYLIL